MPITKEMLEKKIKEYEEQEKVCWADLNQVIGAKLQCSQLLDMLTGEELVIVSPPQVMGGEVER